MFPLPVAFLSFLLPIATAQSRPADRASSLSPQLADVETAAREADDLATELEKRSQYLFGALVTGDERTRLRAAEALRKLGPHALAAGMTENLLYVIRNDPSPAVRAKVIPLVRYADFVGVREAVAAALADKDVAVRESAATWFGNDRTRPDLAVPALAKALTHSLTEEDSPANLSLRRSILFTLAVYGPRAAPADAALVQALKARRWEDRREAFITLTRIRRDKSTLVPLFKERFAAKNPTDPELWAAAISLHELGPLARQFVPDLVRCLRFSLYTVQRKSYNPYIYFIPYSVGEFERLGPTAKAAAPDLLKFFLDGNLSGSDRAYVLLAYSAIATPNRDELKQIAAGMIGGELSTGSHNDRLVVAVRRFGAAIMPHLAEAWERQITNNYLNRAMLWLCWKLGADAAPLLPMIESFYIEPGQDTGRIPAIALSLNGDARSAAQAIKADIEKRKKAAPKMK